MPGNRYGVGERELAAARQGVEGRRKGEGGRECEGEFGKEGGGGGGGKKT